MNSVIMNPLTSCKNIYFIGIGGIGMSALARYFNTQGIKVSGYDKTPTLLTDALIEEGIQNKILSHNGYLYNACLSNKNLYCCCFSSSVFNLSDHVIGEKN